jgi:baculoviral IAP repeat-containing protein 6
LSKGIGYGSHGDYNFLIPSVSSSAGAKFNALASLTNIGSPSDDEKRLTIWFSALEVVLPSFAVGQQTTPFDSEPPPILEFMLRRSPLLPRAAELLRNDSMEAILARHDLYEALLRLIGTISSHTSTSAVVYNELTIYPLEEQLAHFQPSSGGSNATSASYGRPNTRSKGKEIDRGSSIVDIIANLARQCRHLNRVATAHSKEFVAAESARMLALSQRICQLASQHEANQPPMSQCSKAMISESCVVKQPVSNVLTRSKEAEFVCKKAREEFKALHRNSSVVDLPEQELLSNFQFRDDAEAVSSIPAGTSKGRMKKLVAQVTNLRTSLPEGIWVRHGNSRLDVMKVLMIGPRGTPYEHGLFEFDLFCPADFPNSPPLMRFRTNGGGRVRFNPNLYQDGKGSCVRSVYLSGLHLAWLLTYLRIPVCLSLLGTWSGEGWNAAYSTILQVLVSIHGTCYNLSFVVDCQCLGHWTQPLFHRTSYYFLLRESTN